MTTKQKLSREWWILGFALLLLALFLFMFNEVNGGPSPGLVRADDALLTFLRERRTTIWNQFFLEFTALGSFSVLFILSLSVTIFLLLARRWSAAFQLLLSAILTAQTTAFLKTLSARPRPPIEHRLDLASGFSFPSGHASSGAGIYLTLGLLFMPLIPPRLRRGFLAYITAFVLLLAFSRIYLAVHYPSDILGGLALGTGIACLVHLWLHPTSAWKIFRRSA